MKPQTKRIIAIVALVFMGIFSVSLIAFFVDSTLLNGAIGLLVLFSGGIGIALYLMIWVAKGFPHQEKDELEGNDEDDSDEPEGNDGKESILNESNDDK